MRAVPTRALRRCAFVLAAALARHGKPREKPPKCPGAFTKICAPFPAGWGLAETLGTILSGWPSETPVQPGSPGGRRPGGGLPRLPHPVVPPQEEQTRTGASS